MEIADFALIAKEGVSFAVLLAVLFGVYRLTNRIIDVLSEFLKKLCETLDRIADAIERKRIE